MESNDLFALADELRELKETKKRLEDELKTVGLEIDRVDADLAERIGSFTWVPESGNLNFKKIAG